MAAVAVGAVLARVAAACVILGQLCPSPAFPPPVCSGVQPGACQWGTIYEGQLRALHIPLGQLWNCKPSAHSGYIHPQISIDLEISAGLLMTAVLWPDPSSWCRPAAALLLPAQPSGVNGAGSALLLPTATRRLSRKHGREGVFFQQNVVSLQQWPPLELIHLLEDEPKSSLRIGLGLFFCQASSESSVLAIKVPLSCHRCMEFINKVLGFKYSPSDNRLRPWNCHAQYMMPGHGKAVCSPGSPQPRPRQGQLQRTSFEGGFVGQGSSILLSDMGLEGSSAWFMAWAAEAWPLPTTVELLLFLQRSFSWAR